MAAVWAGHKAKILISVYQRTSPTVARPLETAQKKSGHTLRQQVKYDLGFKDLLS